MKRQVAILVAGLALGAAGGAAIDSGVPAPGPVPYVLMATLRPDETGAVYVVDATCIVGDRSIQCSDARTPPIQDEATLQCAQQVLTYIAEGVAK